MLKKLLVALVASAFALGAYAQAPKAEPKADTKTEAKKDEKAKSTMSTRLRVWVFFSIEFSTIGPWTKPARASFGQSFSLRTVKVP